MDFATFSRFKRKDRKERKENERETFVFKSCPLVT